MGTQARFNRPMGLASDAAGNVYVADMGNATIRKISSTGVVSTLAGSPGLFGVVDGSGPAARFRSLVGIVSDAGGTLWVTDFNRVRKVTPAGVVTTLVDTGDVLSGLARDAGGNLYASAKQGKSVLKITTTPEGVGSFGDIGVVVPDNRDSYSGIAVDAQGNIYVTSSTTHTVRKLTPAGVVSTFAGTANSRGSSTTIGAAVAQLSSPSGVVIDAQGNVVVTDESDYVRTISPAGMLVSVLQMPPAADVSGNGGLGVTVDSTNRLVVVIGDALYTPSVHPMLAEYAGHNSRAGFGFSSKRIKALRANATGGVYFIEPEEFPNWQLRSASADGVVTNVGTRFSGFTGNEEVAVISPSGEVYSTERVMFGLFPRIETGGSVKKLSSDGTRSTVWSSSTLVPLGIQFDSTGNLHLQYRPVRNGASGPPSAQSSIARIDGSNAVVGQISVSSQGNGTDWPGLTFAIDPAGGYFVSDSLTVSKVTATGQLTLLAGSVDAPGAVDGIGSTARFNGIASLAVDSAGNVLVADQLNHAIRKITPSGVVTTVVGQLGKVGGSVGALPGTLELPDKVVLDAKGVLYIGAKDALLRVQFP